MLLPFAEKAWINDQKLIGYCLSETHATGRHKARVFESALGITKAEYLLLKETILAAVLVNEAQAGGLNRQGELYTVDFMMSHNSQNATVRTAWIVRFTESFPRLTSYYIND